MVLKAKKEIEKKLSRQMIDEAIRKGLEKSLSRPVPLRLSEWAEEHFYLSAESSYIQGTWESLPFQVAIMDAISNENIREVWFIKSARVGATKMMLAAMGYFAEHKKRNQCLWQPTDGDATEFCKTELDTMIRDVPVVREVFPHFRTRNRYNTMDQKQFLGSMMYIRGGKSAKNYRRLSLDVAMLDELDAFDTDVDSEGDPVSLASKRIEGSTFPKLVAASTPKIRDTSIIERQAYEADMYMKFFIPCPHCDFEQALEFGGKDVNRGFKWVDRDPDSVQYLCINCSTLFDQGAAMNSMERGRWCGIEEEIHDDGESREKIVKKTGTYIDKDGSFRHMYKNDEQIHPPISIAFHVWTAYSPMTSWAQICREFFAALKSRDKLKAFTNTTLGETWEDEGVERLDFDILYKRREYYPSPMPDDAAFVTFAIDQQDDRMEVLFDAWGEDEERWSLSYHRLYGDPSRPEIWDKLAHLLTSKTFEASDGTKYSALCGTHDHGGHYSDEVNRFSKRLGIRWLIPVKGMSTYGNPVSKFPRKKNDKGVYLTMIGTDTAKDLLFQRLQIDDPGPGYWHFPISDDFDRTFFQQLVAEERITKFVQGQRREVWVDPGRAHEAWDCGVYGLAACRIAVQNMGARLDVKAVGGRKKKGKLEVRKATKIEDKYL